MKEDAKARAARDLAEMEEVCWRWVKPMGERPLSDRMTERMSTILEAVRAADELLQEERGLLVKPAY